MKNEELSEQIDAQVEQLGEEIGEQYLELINRISDLQYGVEALAAAMHTRLDAHEEYHRKNEHRWGLVRLAGRYPFRFAAVMVALTTAGGPVAVNSGQWIMELIRQLTKGAAL